MRRAARFLLAVLVLAGCSDDAPTGGGSSRTQPGCLVGGDYFVPAGAVPAGVGAIGSVFLRDRLVYVVGGTRIVRHLDVFHRDAREELVHDIRTPLPPGAYSLSPGSDGHYYSTGDGGFFLLDLDPSGTLTVLSHADSIHAGTELSPGRLLWRAGRRLHAVDASDPRNLRILGSVESSEPLGALHVRGSTVYALSGRNVQPSAAEILLVFDFSDPARPREVRTIDTPGLPTAVTVLGTRLLVCDGAAGVSVYGLTDPLSPRLEATVPLADPPLALADLGIFMLGVDAYGGLAVYDYTNPLDPRSLGPFPALGFPLTGVEDGGFVVGAPAGARLWLVGEEGLPAPRARVLPGRIVHDVRASIALVQDGDAAVALATVDAAGDLSPVASGAALGVTWGAVLGPERAAVADGDTVRILRAQGQDLVVEAAHPGPWGTYAAGDELLAWAEEDVFRVLEIADPSRVWELPRSGGPEAVVTSGRTVYTASGSGVLIRLVGMDGAVTASGSLPGEPGVRPVYADSRVLVVSDAAGTRVYELGDPVHPLESFGFPGYPRHVARDGRYLLLGGLGGGGELWGPALVVYDLDTGERAATAAVGGTIFALRAGGGTVFVSRISSDASGVTGYLDVFDTVCL